MMNESRDLRSRSHDSSQRYRVSVDLDRLAGASILTIRKEATFGLRWRWYIRRLVERERIGGVLYISAAVSSGVSSRTVRRRFSDRAIASCARRIGRDTHLPRRSEGAQSDARESYSFRLLLSCVLLTPRSEKLLVIDISKYEVI